MRAIVAESADQLSWQEVPDVSAGPGEVLVKVTAAGVNRADTAVKLADFAISALGFEGVNVGLARGDGRHAGTRRVHGHR